MNAQRFVEIVKTVVEEPAVLDTIKILDKPPGRNQNSKLLKMSKWFNDLSNEDKIIVQDILHEGINMSVFGFFCLLDGVRLQNEYKGKIEIYYV